MRMNPKTLYPPRHEKKKNQDIGVTVSPSKSKAGSVVVAFACNTHRLRAHPIAPYIFRLWKPCLSDTEKAITSLHISNDTNLYTLRHTHNEKRARAASHTIECQLALSHIVRSLLAWGGVGLILLHPWAQSEIPPMLFAPMNISLWAPGGEQAAKA